MAITYKPSNYRAENASYSMLASPIASASQALGEEAGEVGIPRATAMYMQDNHWAIPTEYRSILSVYYLLHWSAEYFQHKLHEGTIEREGITYQVIYYRCNAAAIGHSTGQLLLSFRGLRTEYKARPVVLVTVS